jgi:hypothetical protein
MSQMVTHATSGLLNWVLISMLLLAGSSCSFGQDETDIKPVLEKWVRNEHIPSGVISLKTFGKATTSDAIEDNVDISFFDLDHRGQKELAIQSGCAAVGNCGLDIYTRVGKTYRRLLTTDMVQSVTPLVTTTYGFRDLELRTHGSATESYHRLFKFDGHRYKRSRCWTEDYSVTDKKGNFRILKKPIITRGCNQEF